MMLTTHASRELPSSHTSNVVIPKTRWLPIYWVLSLVMDAVTLGLKKNTMTCWQETLYRFGYQATPTKQWTSHACPMAQRLFLRLTVTCSQRLNLFSISR